jgi:hypothetical protein
LVQHGLSETDQRASLSNGYHDADFQECKQRGNGELVQKFRHQEVTGTKKHDELCCGVALLAVAHCRIPLWAVHGMTALVHQHVRLLARAATRGIAVTAADDIRSLVRFSDRVSDPCCMAILYAEMAQGVTGRMHGACLHHVRTCVAAF